MAKSSSFLNPKWKDAALSMLGSVPMKGVIKKGAQASKKVSKASKQPDEEGTD
ncbi:hypothetical protein P9265_22265 [Schinkia azotoformans]|uniref:hypothetical protein n=1 Tax=Schinkia azotoformans TaxID=1454 RepID=UPI002E24C7CE|nr:hypothetical protein [Schinkia azotoformans]